MAWNDELTRAFSLAGKVAVVTGAGSGIGRETARTLALAGARIVAADIDEAGLAETAALIGGDVATHRLDIADHTAVEAFADRVVADAGRLDVWLNSAAIGYQHALLETDPARAERVIAINLLGCYWGVAAAGRVMRAQGSGVIINISSSGGNTPVPGVAIYGMTKAAVNSLTWTAAAELGPLGIRVNAIAPGWTETPMARQMFQDAAGNVVPELRDAVLGEMLRRSPLGITGQPTDMAYAALYLASDASRFMTGQILAVNGGTGM